MRRCWVAGRYGTGAPGYRAVRRWPERTWATGGCQGIGRHIARRLIAGGEQVADVPPRLSARTRVFATGQGRKTDATDVHSIALAATRMSGLRPVIDDEQLAVLRILADRRRSLGEDHTRMISWLHQLLLELIAGGAKKDLSAAQAKVVLAAVRPRDAAGQARRRVAAELISDLERIYQRKKTAGQELRDLLTATGTTLTSLNGIGPSGAARLLIKAGDITRFPSKAHFASWNGTAPIDASSGDQVRHRRRGPGHTIQAGNAPLTQRRARSGRRGRIERPELCALTDDHRGLLGRPNQVAMRGGTRGSGSRCKIEPSGRSSGKERS
jgi:transposase